MCSNIHWNVNTFVKKWITQFASWVDCRNTTNLTVSFKTDHWPEMTALFQTFHKRWCNLGINYNKTSFYCKPWPEGLYHVLFNRKISWIVACCENLTHKRRAKTCQQTFLHNSVLALASFVVGRYGKPSVWGDNRLSHMFRLVNH